MFVSIKFYDFLLQYMGMEAKCFHLSCPILEKENFIENLYIFIVLLNRGFLTLF